MRPETIKAVNRYIKSIKMCMMYYKLESLEPREVKVAHQEALEALRKELDIEGIHFPRPLYHYDKHDKKTWKFIDTLVEDDKYIGPVLNPNFAYEGVTCS